MDKLIYQVYFVEGQVIICRLHSAKEHRYESPTPSSWRRLQAQVVDRPDWCFQEVAFGYKYVRDEQ